MSPTPRERPVVVYCKGEPVEAVPVFLATLTAAGRPKVEAVPIYWRCSGCEAILSRLVA